MSYTYMYLMETSLQLIQSTWKLHKFIIEIIIKGILSKTRRKLTRHVINYLEKIQCVQIPSVFQMFVSWASWASLWTTCWIEWDWLIISVTSGTSRLRGKPSNCVMNNWMRIAFIRQNGILFRQQICFCMYHILLLTKF